MHLPVLVDGHHRTTARAYRPSCCLCTNMWITCAQRRRACAYGVEMLGIPLPGRNHDRGLYLGERESHPVHAEKTGIIHMPRRNR